MDIDKISIRQRIEYMIERGYIEKDADIEALMKKMKEYYEKVKKGDAKDSVTNDLPGLYIDRTNGVLDRDDSEDF